MAQSHAALSAALALDPSQHYFLQALDEGRRVEFEAMWVDEARYDVTIMNDHLKYLDVNWVFGFHQYEYEPVLRMTPKHSEIFVFELPGWMLSSTVCCFQFSGGVNCVMVLFSSQTVSNWL